MTKCAAIGRPTCRIEAFQLLRSGPARADFFRMLRLACDGGVWFDADMNPSCMRKCMRPHAYRVAQPFSAAFFRFGKYPRYDIMASAPGHPIIRATLRQIGENILALNASGANGTGLAALGRSNTRLMGITGPHVLQRVICNRSRGQAFVNLSAFYCSGSDSRFGDYSARQVGTGIVAGVEPDASFLFASCPSARHRNFSKALMWQKLGVTNWRSVRGGLRR